ncbi:MAG: osmoprotectant transporter permease [Saprospiraceae bacterium]|nr:osmoprotectant transporter permease [Saprospiraceae bacterium]
MNFFWILWIFDALIALVAVYFFIVGLSDGSVSSFNIKLWLGLLAVLAIILGGSYWLYTHEKLVFAKRLLYLLAIPGFLYLLFLLFILIARPRWN